MTVYSQLLWHFCTSTWVFLRKYGVDNTYDVQIILTVFTEIRRAYLFYSQLRTAWTIVIFFSWHITAYLWGIAPFPPERGWSPRAGNNTHPRNNSRIIFCKIILYKHINSVFFGYFFVDGGCCIIHRNQLWNCETSVESWRRNGTWTLKTPPEKPGTEP